MNYSKLVAALRNNDWSDACPCCDEAMCKDADCIILQAADAIEALQAEQKKTVTQIFGEEQMAWEERCAGLMRQISEQKAYDIRQLPEGLYTVKNGVVYTARVKVSGGNVLNLKTGESHWEDDRIVGGEQVFPKRGEIVRCKECRWGKICLTGQHLGLDGFCSKGEREAQE